MFDDHRDVLLALLRFLHLVAANHDHNKMSLSNLAVVFAPTLFYIRGHKGELMLKEIEIQVSTATTLKLMIEFHEQLLNVRCRAAVARLSRSAGAGRCAGASAVPEREQPHGAQGQGPPDQKAVQQAEAGQDWRRRRQRLPAD